MSGGRPRDYNTVAVLAALEAGQTVMEIAGELNLKPGDVRTIARRFGVRTPLINESSRWRRGAQSRTILECLELGVPVQQLAEHFGITEQAIRCIKRRATQRVGHFDYRQPSRHNRLNEENDDGTR